MKPQFNKIKKAIKEYYKIILIFCISVFSLISFVIGLFLVYVYFYDIPRYNIIGDMPPSIRGTIEFVRNIPYWPYMIKSTNLPIYDIQIGKNDYQKILDALPKSGDDVLDSKTRKRIWAKLSYNGQVRDVEISVHGEMYNNWIFQKKAWQIRLKPGDSIDGTSKFNLVLLDDEAVYAGEYLNMYRAKKLGVAMPEGKFVIVRFNGGPKMIYLQKEGWTSEFLVKNFGNANGNFYGEAGALTDPIFESTKWWQKYVSIKGEENNFADLDYLLNLVKNADDTTFKREIVKILDMDTFYKWQIHSLLAGSIHEDENHNMRIYFDKEKMKFFLVSWDISVWDYASLFEHPRFGKIIYDIDIDYNPLVNRILNTPEFLLERNRRLWEYVKDDININDDIAYLDNTTKQIKPAVYQDDQKYDRNGKADATMQRIRSNILTNYAFLRDQLAKSSFFAAIDYKSSSSYITLDFSYISASPISFKGLQISGISSTNDNVFYLYEDENQNGKFDWQDQKITTLKYENNTLSAKGFDIILYSNRARNGYYQPITVATANKKFFIVALFPFNTKAPSVAFDIFNSVTNTDIQERTQLNNNDSFDSLNLK